MEKRTKRVKEKYRGWTKLYGVSLPGFICLFYVFVASLVALCLKLLADSETSLLFRVRI